MLHVHYLHDVVISLGLTRALLRLFITVFLHAMPLLEPVYRPVGADAKVCMYPQAHAWDLVAVTLDNCAGRKRSVDASFIEEHCS